MVNYGLTDRVVLITGANNPQGIGATTALAFAREGAKVVLVYKKICRQFDENKIDRNGADRYFAANAGNADIVESKLKAMNADYLILESVRGNSEGMKLTVNLKTESKEPKVYINGKLLDSSAYTVANGVVTLTVDFKAQKIQIV